MLANPTPSRGVEIPEVLCPLCGETMRVSSVEVYPRVAITVICESASACGSQYVVQAVR